MGDQGDILSTITTSSMDMKTKNEGRLAEVNLKAKRRYIRFKKKKVRVRAALVVISLALRLSALDKTLSRTIQLHHEHDN